MLKIIILDFESGEVYITHFDKNKYEDFEDFLLDFNKKFSLELSETNCEWMKVENLTVRYL